jgi:hypothetical protein
MKLGRIGHIYFYILAAVVLSASNMVTAQPVKPSPDEIFNWAERKYNALFPAGSSTQTLQDSGGLIYYRHYTTTGNYLGIQLNNILGMGTFTGGPVTQLGTIADIQCQVFLGTCAAGEIDNKRYLHWEEVQTPTRNCSIRPFKDSIYCGAFIYNGSSWSAIASAPPVLSQLPSGLPFYQVSSNSTETVYEETKGGTRLRFAGPGRFGWNGGSTAVWATTASDFLYFRMTKDGGTTWSNLTTYRIGPDIPAEGGSISRLVEGLAYAYGTIFAAIRQPARQGLNESDKRYMLMSPDGGQTWFETSHIGRINAWYFIGATSGYIATEEGTFSLRFANGIILDRIPFDGGAKGAVSQFFPVGPTGDTLFANEPFVGLWLLDGVSGKFYRPTPEWGGVSYFNYFDFGVNGIIAVGRGSTSYITSFPLVKKETPQ